MDKRGTSLREQKRIQSRNAILDACADELADRAEDEIRIEDIAARARLSRATVFNYFAARREIIVGIADREIDGLSALVDERRGSGEPPLETIGAVMYQLVGRSFTEPVVAWRVLRTMFDDPSREDLPVRRLLRLVEALVATAQSAGDLRAELDAGACARAIVGTYFAELFVIAGGNGGNESVARSDFDAVAEQLVAPWTPAASAGGPRG